MSTTSSPTPEKLRAWWAHRQGLTTRTARTPAATLADTGWARSVGGANPYITLFARTGVGRTEVDADVAALNIHELPSARGCTYVLPEADYALGLTLSRPAAQAPLKVLARLGVDGTEVDRLAGEVLTVLDEATEPMDPAALRETLGDAVRSLGEEGRKKGESTTLPATLGILQTAGEIRRVPVNGRLDQQRYAYVRWQPPPPVPDPGTELARRYFAWTGPASLAHFRWFSGFGVRDAKAALAGLDLRPVPGTELLIASTDLAEFEAYAPPAEAAYALVCWIDALVLLRRDLSALLDPADAAHPAFQRNGVALSDLSSQAIVDRGRIVGLWEYDPDAGELVWASFVKADDAMRAAVAETAGYVREQLGDLRGSSLDSPKSRRPRIEAIRALKG